jgi:hypothetical protein
MCIGLYVEYPLFLLDFKGTRLFSTDFLKKKGLKYQISWKLVQLVPSCSISDGRMDTYDEANNSRFSQICENT